MVIAEKMAALLVESKQAACVSISSPITSIYRWQGKIETEKEVMFGLQERAKDTYKGTLKGKSQFYTPATASLCSLCH